MNVYPGGKQPALRDGLWKGNVQIMTLLDGTPKGMKMVLQERGVDVKGMNAAKMREKLNTYSDFSTQKNILEELQRPTYVCSSRNIIVS